LYRDLSTSVSLFPSSPVDSLSARCGRRRRKSARTADSRPHLLATDRSGSRSCAAAGTSIKGLRLCAGRQNARHYMVISRGNLPSELWRGRARARTRQTMPACPLGTKYQQEGTGRDRTRGQEQTRVGLDGGDITKMSENVTHLIIYAPRSSALSSVTPRPPPPTNPPPLCDSRELSASAEPPPPPPPPRRPGAPSAGVPTLRVRRRRRILARN